MGKIAFLFAGQGAQKPGMGKDLYDNEKAARKVFDMGEELRRGTLEQCFDSSQDILTQTENTQPCLYLMDLACARVLEAYGIKADMAAGFSLGEIAAIAYTGVLSDEEAFKLVTLRGNEMSACSKKNPGAMAAVLKISSDVVESLSQEFEEIYPVNYNCPGQTVVAGNKEQLDKFSEAVKAVFGRALPLKVSGAFHTPYMKDATKKMKEYLNNVDVNSPNIPLISNTTGEPYPQQDKRIKELLAEQASNSVKWEATIRYLFDKGVDTFIEVGAGTTLTGLVNKTLENVKTMNVSDMETLHNVVQEYSKGGNNA